MAYMILPTTAELIISVTDAVILYSNSDVTDSVVSNFLDIPIPAATNALEMSCELNLLSKHPQNNNYKIDNKFAKYIVTNNQRQKAVIFRLFLEEYPPFIFFKSRLSLTGSVDAAAEQTKSYYSLQTHREEIKSTLINLGQYTKSIISEGAGLYTLSGNNSIDEITIPIIDDIIDNIELAKNFIIQYLGDEIVSFVQNSDSIINLSNSRVSLNNVSTDPRTPIVHAGNAVESFLFLIGNHVSISMNGANGINAKVEKLKQSGKISTKQYNISKYIGHLRNAADHGIDAEIQGEWIITPETSKIYLSVCLNFIKNYYANTNSNYLL